MQEERGKGVRCGTSLHQTTSLMAGTLSIATTVLGSLWSTDHFPAPFLKGKFSYNYREMLRSITEVRLYMQFIIDECTTTTECRMGLCMLSVYVKRYT